MQVKRHFPRVPLLLLAGALVTCTEVPVTTPRAPDEDRPAPTPTGAAQLAVSTAIDPAAIMWDTFSRVVSSGWGTADVGGAWYAQPTGPTFSVDGSRGVITATDTRARTVVGIGPVHGSSTLTGYGLDVGGLVSFQLGRMPDGETSRHNIHVFARRNDRVSDSNNYYAFRVRPSRTSLELRIEKEVNGSSSSVTSNVTVKGSVDTATRWWIRWEVFGTSPATTLRLRVWKDGTTEPTEWHRSAVVNEPALDVSGATGVRFAAASNQVTFPVSLYIDDLQYVRLGEPPPPNQAPVAHPGGPYGAQDGSAIQFNGSASSDPDGDLPLTYAWSFGDGTTGTGATPTKTYAAAGSYTVSLTVTDARGLASAPVTTTATVTTLPNEAPIARPGGPYTGTTGVAVAFDGSASSDPDGDLPLTFAWNFGDGTSGTGATPSHAYATAGTYTVTLTVTDARGKASSAVTTSATVNRPPNQAPVASPGGPYSGNAGTAITFDGTGSSDPDGNLPLTYAWTFGDGGTATGATPAHTYASAGTYTVTLTVTDAEGKPSTAASTTATVAPANPVLIRDTFSRVVGEGWGYADVGGRWFPNSAGPIFRVDGSRGIIEVATATPQNVVGRGLEGYGLDVTGLTSFVVDRKPDGSGRFHTLQVYARRNDRVSDGDNYYRYRVRIIGNGVMDLRIEKNVNGTHTWLTNATPTNVTFIASAKYWLRWEAFGASPATTLRMRIWRDGTAEPTSWQLSVVINEPTLDASGTTGVRFQGPSADQVNWPIRLYVDDLQYSRRN